MTALSQSNLPEISDLEVAADSGGSWTRDGVTFLPITPSDPAYRASFESAMPGTSGISPHHIRPDLSETAAGAYVLGVRVTDGIMWGVGPVLEIPTGGEKRGSEK